MARPDWWDPEAEAEGWDHDPTPSRREADNDARLDPEGESIRLARRYLDRVTRPIVLTDDDEELLAALLDRQDPA